MLKPVCKFALLLGLLFSPSALRSQSVSPAIQELKSSPKHPTKGQFTVRNLSVAPLNVTLELRGLVLKSNTDIQLVPLDSKTTVKLSETSFRLPAKADRTVYFEAESADADYLFAIFSSMVVGRLNQGTQIALHLPAVVYACQKSASHCREKIRREQFGLTN